MNQCHNCANSPSQKRDGWKNLIIKYHTFIFAIKFIPNWRVFWRFVKGYIRVNVFKKEQIRFVEIFVTLACNGRCPFCSNAKFSNMKGDVSLAKYLELIDECAELNVPVICLIGGEPLLYPGLNKLIERINQHGISSMLATNGYLLSEAKIKELAACGLANVTISLHSLDESVHDSILGLPGAWRRAWQAREYCKKYGLSFQLASVVGHRDFVDGGFDKLVRFVEDNKIRLSINPLIPTGHATSQKENLLTFDDVKKLNAVSTTSNYISTHLTNNFFGFGCPAGNAYLGINATGEIFPCFFIPVSLGSVNQMTLKSAWQKACRSPLFKRKHQMCFAAVSREFICKYMDPIFNFPKVPIPIEDHPLYDREISGLPDLAITDLEKATSAGNAADRNS